MDRQRFDYWLEKGILALVLGLLGFAVLGTGAVRSLEWLVIQGLMCGILALWIPRLWTRSNYRLLFPPLGGAVLVFLIYAAFRAHHAEVEYAARSEWLKILVYAFLFFVIVDHLHGQEEMQILVFGLVFLGMAVSLYAVYQFIVDSPYVWHFRKPSNYVHRGSGTFISPNHLAGFLEMVLPLSLAYVMTGRLKATTKVFIGYAGLAMLAGLGVSVSRGGWLAAGAAVVLFFLLMLRNPTHRIPALAVLVLVIGGGVFFFKKTYQAQKRLGQTIEAGKINDVRFQLWKPAIAIWQENFWWGAGPGHFDHAFRKHRPEDIQMRPVYTHNDYLNTLADYGTAGASIIAVALALFFFTVWRVWKYVERASDIRTKPSNRFALVLGAALGIVAILVHSVVDFNMHIPANALVAVTLMALVSAHVRFATERFWVNLRWFGKGAATLILGAGLVFLASDTIAGARHEWFAGKAARTTDAAARVPLLKRAHEARPKNYETVYEIGETLRLWSFHGHSGYEQLAQEAMPWFELGMKLNPLDPYNFARYGMCLHWLGKHGEARPYFTRAVELDPRNHEIVGLMGWHYLQTREYRPAKEWYEKSQRLSWWRLDVKERDKDPAFYLKLIERRLAEEPKE